MSFAEAGYTHQVLRVDLAGGRAQAVVSLLVPRAVQLLRERGWRVEPPNV